VNRRDHDDGRQLKLKVVNQDIETVQQAFDNEALPIAWRKKLFGTP
jgi:hypothetical protein